MPGATWSWAKCRDREKHAHFDTSRSYAGIGGMAPKLHQMVHEKRGKLEELFESSPFNSYWGPEEPDLLIATSGSGWLYSMEAVTDPRSRRVGGRAQAGHHVAPSAELPA